MPLATNTGSKAQSEQQQTPKPQPLVSIIIPARNEEANLAACLDSIVHQDGIAFETIVVDDNSSDRTAEIAASYLGVRVIRAGALPAGWSGKSHAIAQALPHALGSWFLFTDADTVHRGNSVKTGVEEAVNTGADLLSYSPYQVTGSLWERMLQPIIFAELSSKFRYEEVNDPSSSAAAANGQYILVRRKAYEDVGGHEGVKNELLEDVALARAIKAAGGNLRFCYAPEVVSARMYRNLGQIWEGWSKNLSRLFPDALVLAGLRFLEFTLIVGGIGAGISGVFWKSSITIIVGVGIAAMTFSFAWKRFRKAGFDSSTTLIAIPGLPFFSALLINSFVVNRLLKRAPWKGRKYGAELR